MVQLSHAYMTPGKTIALTIQIFVSKVMSLLFNMLVRFVIAFPPKIRHLLISRLQCLSTVILEPRRIKSVTVSTVSPCICHEVMGPDAMILVFWMLNFKPTFSLSYFTLIKMLFSSSSLSVIRVVSVQFSSVQLLSRVWLFATPWIAARQASLSITNSQSSPKLRCIESVMPSSHLILCHPLLLLPPIPPNIRVFSNESTLSTRWPKYWSFSLSISPSNEHPGLVSFRMDWLDLLAVQGTCKSLLQYHSSEASILQHSAFFTVQLSHPYLTTGKTIALTRRTFVVISLLLNMLSRLVITFLPRSKRLLISWLQSPSAVILEPPK